MSTQEKTSTMYDTGQKVRSFVAHFAVLVFKAGFILSVLFLFGFYYFIHTINTVSWDGSEKADGISVLTGGKDRVAVAYGLLSDGFGQRLLISGVYETTNLNELVRLFPERKAVLECCVDLGYNAANTKGNARETKEWAEKNGFRSIIVVTSNYHMPRSLTELGHRLQGTRIIPYPVSSPNVDTLHWWRSIQVVKLLGYEYIKYLYVVVRTTSDDIKTTIKNK